MAVTDEIKKDHQVCFKRIYMKRRLYTPVGDQYYETDWYEITDWVSEVSPIVWNIDDVEMNEFTQGNFTLVCDNKTQKFSPTNYTGSLFYGYLTRHKTKIKIVAGYYDIENDTEYAYDVGIGFINEDEISVESDSTVTIPCISPSMMFDEWPAHDVNEGTLGGGETDWYDNETISTVVQALYDLQKDGDYVFHPFLDGADITPGNNITADLYNFSDWTCREALIKMAQVSSSCFFIGTDWKLKFRSKTPAGGSVFTFSNTGSDVNIIGAWAFNNGLNKVFTRVAWYQTDPLISAEEAGWGVGDQSSTWKYGRRPYTVDNRLVTTTATRQSICDNILAEYKDPKMEISLRTKFVPQLNLLDKVTINYWGIPTKYPQTLWKKSFWGKGLWQSNTGAIIIKGINFKIMRLEHNVMEFTTDSKLREV